MFHIQESEKQTNVLHLQYIYRKQCSNIDAMYLKPSWCCLISVHLVTACSSVCYSPYGFPASVCPLCTSAVWHECACHAICARHAMPCPRTKAGVLGVQYWANLARQPPNYCAENLISPVHSISRPKVGCFFSAKDGEHAKRELLRPRARDLERKC